MAVSSDFFNYKPGTAVGDNTGLGGIFTSIWDLVNGVTGKNSRNANQAAAAADPFASQRGQYMDQLAALMKNPESFKTDPGYRFALSQGQEAIERASNALYGTRRTGSLAPELAKFTEGYASQAYDARINQLAQLAGANVGSPGTAGAILAGGFDKDNSSLASGLGGIGSLLAEALGLTGAGASQFIQMLNRLLGGGSGTNPYDPSGTNTGPRLPSLPSGNLSEWGGNVFPDPGNGTYGPQQPSFDTGDVGTGFDPNNYFTIKPDDFFTGPNQPSFDTGDVGTGLPDFSDVDLDFGGLFDDIINLFGD